MNACPECGGPLDWPAILYPVSPPLKVNSLAIILAPHVLIAVLIAAFSVVPRDSRPNVLLVAPFVLLYLFASFLCAAFPIHTLMGAPNTAWSRLFAAAVAIPVCVVFFIVITVLAGLALGPL